MNPSARITVTTGPDRGSLIDIADEMIQIGRGDENALILHDPLLDQHQISIVRRGGRHAIFVVGTDEVEVSGTRIPPDQWVWLPQSANLQLTRRTTLEFLSLIQASEADYEAAAAVAVPAAKETTAKSGAPAKRAAPANKSDTKSGVRPKPAVARFITDQAGDPLVKLGEDGHLPDLELQEGTAHAPQRKPRDEKSNSLMLVVLFVVSAGMSVGMLLLDFDIPTGTAHQVQIARRVITIFYGDDQVPLDPYQKLLRRANWAHTQGDFAREKKIYRDILAMLRAENQNSITGLTRLPLETQRKFDELSIADLKSLSSPNLDFSEIKRNDDRLARLLSILLSSG